MVRAATGTHTRLRMWNCPHSAGEGGPVEAQARKMTRDDQALGPEEKEESSSQVAVRVRRKSWFERNAGTAACNSGQTRKRQRTVK